VINFTIFFTTLITIIIIYFNLKERFIMAERITGHTELIGLIAYPIRHSSSPKMHNEAFAKLGLDYAYLAFEVDNSTLEDTIKGFRAMKVRGSNVSMPNKTVVHKYLDKLSPAAELCGAVNTIVNDDGVLTGHITDGMGYMAALKDAGIDVIGKKMTIVGAGGAATAIEIQAALDGVSEISIFNIKDGFWERAEQTVKNINEKTNCKATLYDLADLEVLKREIESSYIFTNATGMGMKPLEGKTYIPDKNFFRPELIVVDIVYSPTETAMLKMAKEVGCKTMNGLGMMLFQGAAAFEMWTGKPMPIEYMKEILDIKY
jgi:shikimate dehydrogenase